MVVRLIERRRFEPPRSVEVERDGTWYPGLQSAWQLCDDGRGWTAEVEYVMRHDWGLGKHLEMVGADWVRPARPSTHLTDQDEETSGDTSP